MNLGKNITCGVWCRFKLSDISDYISDKTIDYIWSQVELGVEIETENIFLVIRDSV